MEEKPHWIQVAILTAGELAFAVVAVPLYLWLVLPSYPEGSLPGFIPIIATGVSPILAVVGAIGLIAVSIGLMFLLIRLFGYDRLHVEAMDELVRSYSLLDCIPIFAAAGFAEEFLFRVVFTDAFGLLIGSILFTAVHAAYWKKPLMLLDVFLLALLLGAFYLATKSLLLCAVAHGVYNLIVCAILKRGDFPLK